jgi:hypothetical protein
MLALRRAALLRRPPTAPPAPPAAALAHRSLPLSTTADHHHHHHHHNNNNNKPAVDFTDTASAYSSLATADLLRAYLVFRACGLRPLVAHADSLLQTAYSVLGKGVTEALVKATFFRHFCAGETAQLIRPRVERLRKAGVGGILDYAAEADVVGTTAAAYTEGAIQCR